MKSSKPFYLSLILLLLCISSAKSQWIPCQGIEGAYTRDIMTYDSELFIITSGNGIFKRSISQSTWDSACLAGSYWKIRATENVLYCFGATYFYRSMDNGNSWIFDEDYSWVYDMDVADSVVFIIYGGMLMRSLNEGDSWMSVHPDTNLSGMDNIYAQSGHVFCSDYRPNAVFHSNDFGDSWMKLPVFGSKGYINDLYLFQDDIWMATDTSIYLYNEDLQIWIQKSDSLPVNAYPQCFFEFDNQLFCGSNKGLYFFDEQDSAWHADNIGLESLAVLSGYPQGDTIFLATGSGPFYRIAGSDWISDYDELFQLDVRQVFIMGPRIYANVQGSLYYSDDITDGFSELPVQEGFSFNEIIVTDTAWYAATKTGFAISLDSGLTWSDNSEGLGGKAVYEIDVTDSFYFAKSAGHAGIFRTQSDAIAWEWLDNEIGTSNVWGLTSLNNVLFASVYAIQGLYRSVDYGQTFTLVPEGGNYSPELFVKDSLIFILRDYSVIYFSDDAGETWNTWIAGFEDENIACMDLTNDYEITILGGAIPPYIDYYLELFTPEEPYGKDILDNLPYKSNPWITNVLFDNGRIIVTPNYYGLWYRDDLMVGIKDDVFAKPAASSRLNIYPNPAKDLIHVHFQNKLDNAEYQVIDYSGKMMMKGTVQNASNDFLINIPGLASGIYLVVIQEENNVFLGKFLKTE